MNKQIFEAAHIVTAEIHKSGESYRVTFSAVLKQLFALMPEARRESERKGESIRITFSDLYRKFMCKARAAVRECRATEQAAIAKNRAPSSSRRYVTSLFIAQRDGLNHGRAWVCSEMDIIRKGALPEWEGDLICYVYI